MSSESSTLTLPTLDEIRAAQSHLQGLAIRTPLIKFNADFPNLEIYLKCEQFQPISSFKIRGAGNAVKMLSYEDKRNGIVTASAGNMAQGLAWIARKEKIPCRVLVPETANETKLKAIERLKGEVTKCTFEEWWKVIVTHECPMLDGYFIHPVCSRHVMAGNGTIGLEILEDLPDCDAIIVPYGGGALISGIAAGAKSLRPSIEIFASEIETAAPLASALAHHQITKILMQKSWVDGIGSSSVLDEMWPIVKSCVDQSLVVTLKETAMALKLLMERNHIICEGASATSLAAALYYYYSKEKMESTRHEPWKVVVVLSGAGIDNETLIQCLRETL